MADRLGLRRFDRPVGPHGARPASSAVARMPVSSRFHVELSPSNRVDVPGLHSSSEFICDPGMEHVPLIEWPAYSRTEIASFFVFVRSPATIGKLLRNWPEKGSVHYIDPPSGHEDPKTYRPRYPLPTVERLLHHWCSVGAISFAQFIVGIQVVAWVARGWRLAP